MLAPVVPAHLPQLGNFRLQEYRGLATHRFGRREYTGVRVRRRVVPCQVGQLHPPWGWFARNVDWYDDVIIECAWFGRPLTVFRILQYVGHVGVPRVCVSLLWRFGVSVG